MRALKTEITTLGLAILLAPVFVLPVLLTPMPPLVFALSLLLAGLMLWLSSVDFLSFRIPNTAVGATAILGVGAVGYLSPGDLLLHVVAAGLTLAVIYGVSRFLYRRQGSEYLGLGDVKLISAGVIWVGPLALPGWILIASLSGSLFGLWLRLRKTPITDRRIPFGPFLGISLLMVWLYGPIFF